jgi:L,D-peptidoglycan transpeptidase YkuD (ErfK/YbiS/YcfS/YnhG family)
MTATPPDAYPDRAHACAPRPVAAGLPGGAEDPGRNRHRRPRGRGRRTAVAVVAGAAVVAAAAAGYLVVTGHSGVPRQGVTAGHAGIPGAARAAEGPPGPPAAPVVSPPGSLPAITGLGPKTRAQIPAGSRQVLVASGAAKNSSDTVVTLWTRTANGRWLPGSAWPAHNALRGWTASHHAGDLHSPIGVYTLSDAGGFEPDPGTKLPYHHSAKFRAGGVGFDGEPLDEAFDYVIAIDYNRVRGTSPLDGTQPMGQDRGGGIWVHVDHGGPTHGCVSISADHMVDLLHTLLPADHPVIVMGDRGSLAT